MCFLTWGRAGWSADTSRTGPWVLNVLSGASRIKRPKLSSDTAGTIVLFYARLLFVFTIVWVTCQNACVCTLFCSDYDLVCFIFVMRVVKSLDKALPSDQHDLQRLFFSETIRALWANNQGNILITTSLSQHCVFGSMRWVTIRDVGGLKFCNNIDFCYCTDFHLG